MDNKSIRYRDKFMYCKENGPIPSGYNMHHLWYSEEYDPASFVIITNEEHEKIHGCKISSGEGFNYYEYKCKWMEDHREENNKRRNERYYADREQVLLKQKEYREEHKEEIKKREKKYREEHKEECNERSREYYKNHKQQCFDANKKYHEEHEEEIKEYQKKYREEHKEEIREYRRKWYLTKKHREKLIAKGVI